MKNQLPVAVLIAFLAGAQAFAAVQLSATILLRGVEGRFDHFAVDTKAKRLFVAALGNNSVEMVDVAGDKRLHTIKACSKPQGVAFLMAENQLVVANGGDGTLRFLDGSSYQLLKSVSGLEDVDNVRYDRGAHRIYAGYGDGALAVFDMNGNKAGEIRLKGHPESFQLEEAGNRIFVNVPSAREVVVIDREKRAVLAAWPMGKFQANFPMALDEEDHLLFVGCRRPARLVVFDTSSGRQVAETEISGDTDDLFYDRKNGNIYISCGEGFLDVAQRSPAGYTRTEHVPTRPGARTCVFSPELDLLFLAVPKYGGGPAEIRVFSTKAK